MVIRPCMGLVSDETVHLAIRSCCAEVKYAVFSYAKF
jgi:hypothetical protein